MKKRPCSLTATKLLQKRKGFTLTEIAIVLGIIGIILSSIWIAAASVYSNMKLASAQRALLAVAQNMRAFHAGARSVDATINMNQTGDNSSGSTMVYMRAALFPSDLLDTGDTTNAAKVYTPYGPHTRLSIISATSSVANDAFEVIFDGIPYNTCVVLLTSVAGAGREPGMLSAGGNKSGQLPTLTPLTRGISLGATATNCVEDAAGSSAGFVFLLNPA